MTALFIASFTEQWLCTHDHVPALTGLLSTLVCLLVLGPGRFLIPAMLLITLAYAAANAEGQLSAEQSLVEVEVFAFFLAAEFELAQQRLLVHANAHGGYLHGAPQHLVPNKMSPLRPGRPSDDTVK